MVDNSAGKCVEDIKNSATIKNAATVKVIVIAVLFLLMLIPIRLVRGLINEREATKVSVVNEISSKWGAAQTLAGPVLTLPYKNYYKTSKGETRHNTKHIHLLPETLNVVGDIAPEKRYRGIYEVVLYGTKLDFSGSFSSVKYKELNLKAEDIIWNDAYISVGVTDMTGIKEEITLNLNGKKIGLSQGAPSGNILKSAIGARAKLSGGFDKLPFSFTVNINGSKHLFLTPTGNITTVELNSPWPDPSFTGNFLPVERTISADGFSAKWRVLHINRSFPQYWKGDAYKLQNFNWDEKDPAFGVDLFTPVDIYSKSMRAVKYASLFIIFTFAAFFLSEVISGRRVHPLQYLFVGSAIVVFYSLLISISEHLGFGLSYLMSGLSVVALVGLYSSYVLKSRSLSVVVAVVMALSYGFFYMLLMLQDYALLFGSIGVFVILAIIMFMTRNIDWYEINLDKVNNGSSEES